MLNKHSTTAPLPQSVHQFGGGKWGGGEGRDEMESGNRGRVSLSYREPFIGSGWAGTWDVVPLPPVLRLQACIPTLRSQASSL